MSTWEIKCGIVPSGDSDARTNRCLAAFELKGSSEKLNEGSCELLGLPPRVLTGKESNEFISPQAVHRAPALNKMLEACCNRLDQPVSGSVIVCVVHLF